jgi:hypothetical protein|tara:strand:- start:477 stop:848 length:372 start_codon:yes stop_codon:yes gene_type:complete
MSLFNILVIDDENSYIEEMRRHIKLYFRQEISVASSLDEVKQKVPANEYDLYFLGNPTGTWKEIAGYIRSQHEDARIVLNVHNATDIKCASADIQEEVQRLGIEEIVDKNEINQYLRRVWEQL